AGWIATTSNGFNPLELQNPATVWPQLGNIALYYAALFPFFFLAGFAVSLNFVVYSHQVGKVYGYDLLGAGLGACFALVLMAVLHPFHLVPVLLPLLAVATILTAKGAWRVAAVGCLLVAEVAIFLLASPRVNEFKPIYAPLNVPESRVVAERYTPRGVYQLLDNFTERLDTDVSNNAGALGTPAPPRAFGLERDGARSAALPMDTPQAGPAPAALDAAPYAMLAEPRVLILGAAGGFRVAEVLKLGAAGVTVIEPEPMLREALMQGFGSSPALPRDPRVQISDAHPLRAEGAYDLVDISGDFLGSADANRHTYTVEALADLLGMLQPGGMISLPIGIRELPVYAVRVLATAHAALLEAGIKEPAAHLAVIRSAWNLRVLMARDPLTPERMEKLLAFAEARSFDISYAPHLSLEGREIWNDLPAISLDSGMVQTGA
ncbi:MAG: hypothetical protein ACK5PU_04290, partial [bacterium]